MTGTSVLVAGLGVTGMAAARHLRAEGRDVVVFDDAPREGAEASAADLGVELVVAPDSEGLAVLVREAEFVVVSPGVPARHPVFALAADAATAVISEIELAFTSARVPIVAVTGTNGKTTVTTMIAAMLEASGLRTVAAGNIGLPLVDAVEQDVDAIVAEVSSFQLEHTVTFRPEVAVWLNLAEDHLDWHPTMAAYAAAKARIWANQRNGDLAIVNAADDAVMAAAAAVPARLETFGRERGDWSAAGGVISGPPGEIVRVAELRRALPHDVDNALAAVAASMAVGARASACASVLSTFTGLPHRVELVGQAGGVQYYDDSKATTPASVLAAMQGFDSVVLIAGGRNKGLDLGGLAQEVSRLRAVVAIGEATPDIERAFEGRIPVITALSMKEAVVRASQAARPGDTVLLSPGCASYDWYSSYAERGDDFAREVRRTALGEP